jgi:hypothetical protein
MRSSCTRPNRAPIDSTHPTSGGHCFAFSVQTPSRSALPCSQKPFSSIVPVAEVTGAKKVAGSVA